MANEQSEEAVTETPTPAKPKQDWSKRFGRSETAKTEEQPKASKPTKKVSKPKPNDEPKPKKVSFSTRLYPHHLALLQAKIGQGLLEGKRITIEDLIAEAIEKTYGHE